MRFVFFICVAVLTLAGCQKTEAEAEHSVENTPTTGHPWDQWGEAYPSWVEPIEPFRIIGNVYYVGVKDLASFLITSEEGHVLIDGTLPQNVSQIVENINSLGLDIEDIKILLNSHAHFDHSGGLKELKALTGAKFIASEGDRSALEGGFYLGAEDNENYSAPPVSVDQTILDGKVLTLGNIRLKANITPGHSRGCTSWTMTVIEDDVTTTLSFFCSATVAGNRLIPPQYAGIVDDYKLTFDKTRDWKPDIFLSNHPSFFNMLDKRERQKAGDTLAFVDREGFPAMMKRLEADFEEKLAKAQHEETTRNAKD